MSDENNNGRNPAPGGRQPLTLKPRGAGSVSAGTVKQSFSHGRTKTVVVETKRARTHGGTGGNLAAPSAAEVPVVALGVQRFIHIAHQGRVTRGLQRHGAHVQEVETEAQERVIQLPKRLQRPEGCAGTGNGSGPHCLGVGVQAV